MSFSNDVKNELIKLKMWKNDSKNQEKKIKNLIIKEAFIKYGYINDPKKEYHLEITFQDELKAKNIKDILKEFNLEFKLTKKGKYTMIYIKEGEAISDFLALIGAHSSVLKFEEIRVLRETSNNINRIVNCETANINKTIIASVNQIENINTIKNTYNFESLDDDLKEIANLRVANPELTYEELGRKLERPLSKSAISQRFKKIEKLANDIKKHERKRI